MATLPDMERALQNAHNAGDIEAARVLAAAIARARTSAVNLIPGMPVAEATPTPPEPSLGQQIVGAAETALALGTGATTGAVGFVGGTGVGLAQEILSGRFGTQESLQRVGQAAQRGARAGTFEPRTATGREMTQEAGQFLGEVLPPVLPIIGPPGVVLSGVRQAAPTAAQAVMVAAPVVQAVVQAPVRATRAIQSAVGLGEAARPAATAATAGRASTGAAATPLELQRFTEAEMAGLRLSEGETKRDPQLLAVEKEQAKTPGIQGPYLQRQQENNQAALRNLEQVLDSTGAETGDLANTGIRVVDTLMSG